MAEDSKTEQAITLKLGDFSQIGISKILNLHKLEIAFCCCHGNQFVKSGSLVKNDKISKPG